MKKIFALIAALAMVLAFMGVANAQSQPKNIRCDSTVTGGTYKNVTVRSGDSCTLSGVTVTGNVHGMKGSVDISILDGTVAHNVQVNGSTGTVRIGNKTGCKYDPPVGNNVHVTNSHNVVICYVNADNNIMVTRNDGRVTVRDSSAGNNLSVSRQLPYVSDGNDNDHRHPEYVRILDNTWGNHLFHSNPQRPRTIVR